jgi:hypothetical protein
MFTYRLFFFGYDGHISRATVIECPSDDDAIAAAQAALNSHQAVEVWHLGRHVGRREAVKDTGGA